MTLLNQDSQLNLIDCITKDWWQMLLKLKSGSLDVVDVQAFHFLHILSTCTSASDLHVRYVNHIMTYWHYPHNWFHWYCDHQNQGQSSRNSSIGQLCPLSSHHSGMCWHGDLDYEFCTYLSDRLSTPNRCRLCLVKIICQKLSTNISRIWVKVKAFRQFL